MMIGRVQGKVVVMNETAEQESKLAPKRARQSRSFTRSFALNASEPFLTGHHNSIMSVAQFDNIFRGTSVDAGSQCISIMGLRFESR